MIYLDPPFNSNTDYNMFFRRGGWDSAQVKAFDDTWSWDGSAADTKADLLASRISPQIQALEVLLGQNGMMAYCIMMAARLLEMHRVLKPKGLIFLHCDSTASHYLKILLDTIFGDSNYRNEVIWKRTHSRVASRKLPRVHDTILLYSKGGGVRVNPVRIPYDEVYLVKHYGEKDANGRRYQLVSLTGPGTRTGESGKPWRGVDPAATSPRHWSAPQKFPAHVGKPDNYDSMSVHQKLDELYRLGLIVFPEKGSIPRFKRYLNKDDGTTMTDVITDVPPLSKNAAERMDYPTQKPAKLVSRFIQMATEPGDLVLDPFCGCGTTASAAHAMDRRFIGIDASMQAVHLIRKRMMDSHQVPVDVEGLPYTLPQAAEMARTKPFEYEKWMVDRIGLHPNDKQVGDGGSDGEGTVVVGENVYAQVVCQVKGGRVNPDDVRALAGTVEKRSNAAFGPAPLPEDAEWGRTGRGQEFRGGRDGTGVLQKNPGVYDGAAVPGGAPCPAAPGRYGTRGARRQTAQGPPVSPVTAVLDRKKRYTLQPTRAYTHNPEFVADCHAG